MIDEQNLVRQVQCNSIQPSLVSEEKKQWAAHMVQLGANCTVRCTNLVQDAHSAARPGFTGCGCGIEVRCKAAGAIGRNRNILLGLQGRQGVRRWPGSCMRGTHAYRYVWISRRYRWWRESSLLKLFYLHISLLSTLAH